MPWRKPWRLSTNAGASANVISCRNYRGINVLLLELHRIRHRLSARWFATFDQWQALGGMVKKRPTDVPPGEWGCRIVFYRPLKSTVLDQSSGEEQEREFRLLRTYTVFGVDQVQGEHLDKFRVLDEPGGSISQPDFRPAEELVVATGADIRHGGDQAYYRRPSPEGTWPHHADGDYIGMPNRNRFPALGGYYESLLHELAHWSEVRTDFDPQQHRYGASL